MATCERPHPDPCACDECTTWARQLVAEARQKRVMAIPPAAVAEMPLAEFSRGILALACKATGLSEDELRRRAEDIGAELPEPPPPERPTRETLGEARNGEGRRIPEKHLVSVFDSPPRESQGLSIVREFLPSSKTFLVLSGPNNTGKSGAAAWSLVEQPGVFVTADEILRIASSRDPDDVKAWRRARDAHLLVIDELGQFVDDKGYAVRVFSGLWDHRYASMRKTIATTNLARGEFDRMFGARVSYRLDETGVWRTLTKDNFRPVRMRAI